MKPGRGDMMMYQDSREDQNDRRFKQSLRSGIRDFEGFGTKLEEESRTRNGGSPRNQNSGQKNEGFNRGSWTVGDSNQEDVPQRGRQGERGNYLSLRAPYLVDEPSGETKLSQSPKHHGSDDGYFSAKDEGGSVSPRTAGYQGKQKGGKQKEQIYKTSPYFMEDVNKNTYQREGVAGTPRQKGQVQERKPFQPKSVGNSDSAGDTKDGNHGNSKGNHGYRASWEVSRSVPQFGGNKARQGDKLEDKGPDNNKNQDNLIMRGHQGRKVQWQDVSKSSPYSYTWETDNKQTQLISKLRPMDMPKLSLGNENRARDSLNSDRKSSREEVKPSFVDTCDRGTQTSIIAVDVDDVEEETDWLLDTGSEQGSKGRIQDSPRDRFGTQTENPRQKVGSMFAPTDVFGTRSNGVRA